MNLKKTELEIQIKETKEKWEKEKSAYLEEINEQKSEIEKQQSRQKEDFEYTFNRDKDQKLEQLEDELAKREKAFREDQESREKHMAEREKDLKQREIAVTEREKNMGALQKQVDTFPATLKESIEEAVKDITEKLTAEAKKNEALIIKGYEGEINVLKAKIEALNDLTNSQKKQILELSSQIENAYTKVQDIAIKAVSNAQYTASQPTHIAVKKSIEETS